jgi:predicted nucleic acid-binding protein
MITAVDTNIVVALWDEDPRLSLGAESALDKAFHEGGLVIAAPVFAELLAAPGRSESFVGTFLSETGMAVDWDLTQPMWRRAGRAFRAYAERRRRQRSSGPRRILADFLIGAHAETRGFQLLTLDEQLYSSYFPELRLQPVSTSS